MRQRIKSSRNADSNATNSPNDPNRIVLRLDETLCVVNISTPHTETDCLSEDHELELDDVTKFLKQDNAANQKKKNIPVLDRMKSFASGVFLQPRSGAVMISSDDEKDNNADDVDTSSSLDNISIDCRGVDEEERNLIHAATGAADRDSDADILSENIETPYDDFAPVIGRNEIATAATSKAHETSVAVNENKGEARPPQYEFRNVNVSIRIKELIGISRIVSRKKLNFQGTSSNSDENDMITAVVSYQGSSIDNNESIFIYSTSLPILFDGEPDKKRAKGYAKWPSAEEGGTELQGTIETSTITFSRSVMKPLKGDNYVDQDLSTNSESPHTGFEVEEKDAKLPTVSDTVAPEIVTLQISLKQGSGEIVPLGVATIIIPWDFQDAAVNVPVVQSYTGVSMKKKKLFAMGSSAYACFSNDPAVKFKIEEGAALGIGLIVSPGKPSSDKHVKSDAEITDSQHKNNQNWQTLGAASSKLTLYQRLQLFTALRKQQDESHEKHAGQSGSQSLNSSGSNASAELDAVQISVAENIPPIPNSQGFVTPQGVSPLYSLKSKLSVFTEASDVPLFELFVDPSEIENDEHLSEISGSDSSCASTSSGGTLTYSLYSAFSLKQRKGPDMTENMLKLLTCDPTFFYKGEKYEEEKIIESASSSDSSASSSTSSSSSSCGSTLSTSVYDEAVFRTNEDVNQGLSFDTPVYKLPVESYVDVTDIAHVMSFDPPVQRLPK
jgi:hypothetical protein